MSLLGITHPVEVGTFGCFRHGGKWLVHTWLVVEELWFEGPGNVGFARMDAWDVLRWAEVNGILTKEEAERFRTAMS